MFGRGLPRKILSLMAVRVGCCGFPKGRGEYFKKFRLVEVQQTFYDPPRLETLKKWREDAPPDFVFAIKAWQLITHEASSPTYRRLRRPIAKDRLERYGSFKATEEVREAWEVTREVARALLAEAILFQCPARFRPTEENLDHFRSFFRSLGRSEPLLVWEPRGEWPAELVASLCEELGLVHGVDPLYQDPATGGVRYLRVHGSSDYKYRCTEEDLERLAAKTSGRPLSYLLFNNVSMWEDALRFKRKISLGE